MIHKTISIFILYVATARFFVEYGMLPGAVKWIVELVSVAFLFVFLVYYAINKKLLGSHVFIYLILFYTANILLGVIINSVGATEILIGCRYHLKYVSFFLLPLVINPSIKEFKFYGILMLIILVGQLPVSLLQRFVIFSHLSTGDVISGTVGSSGVLSVLLISAIVVLFSLYNQKLIKISKFLFYSLILFIPTTINETKATLLFLPIGIFFPVVIFSNNNIIEIVKKSVLTMIIGGLFIIPFVFLYNHIYGSKFETSIGEMIENEKEGRGYFFYGEEKALDRIDSGYRIGRLDSIMMAFNHIQKDVGQLLFGIGVGRAVNTKIPLISIEESSVKSFYPEMTTVSHILWETGIVGLIIYFFQLFFILIELKKTLGNTGFLSAISAGWSGVTAIYFITTIYLNVFNSDVINTMFWLFSGIIISINRSYIHDNRIN